MDPLNTAHLHSQIVDMSDGTHTAWTAGLCTASEFSTVADMMLDAERALRTGDAHEAIRLLGEADAFLNI